MGDKAIHPFHPTKHYNNDDSPDTFQYDGRKQLSNQTVDVDNLPIRDNVRLEHISRQHSAELDQKKHNLLETHRFHHNLPNTMAYDNDSSNNNKDENIINTSNDDESQRSIVSERLGMNKPMQHESHKPNNIVSTSHDNNNNNQQHHINSDRKNQ